MGTTMTQPSGMAAHPDQTRIRELQEELASLQAACVGHHAWFDGDGDNAAMATAFTNLGNHIGDAISDLTLALAEFSTTPALAYRIPQAQALIDTADPAVLQTRSNGPKRVRRDGTEIPAPAPATVGKHHQAGDQNGIDGYNGGKEASWANF